MKYNDTVWQQPLTSEYQAKLLSQIFKLPVDQEEINLLKQRFIEHLNFLRLIHCVLIHISHQK